MKEKTPEKRKGIDGSQPETKCRKQLEFVSEEGRMDQIDTECFEILNVNIYDETLMEFVVSTSTDKIWTSRKVAGLNAEMQRDNPGEYANGMRYSYRRALPDDSDLGDSP